MQHRNTAYKSGKYKLYPHVVMGITISDQLSIVDAAQEHCLQKWKIQSISSCSHGYITISDQLSIVL